MLALAVIAALWAAVVGANQGFVIDAPWGRISSHDQVRPLLVGLFLFLFYVAAWRRHWREDLGPIAPDSPAGIVGALAAVAMLLFGIERGTHIAGGPDPSGYVSEAALFARGELTVPAPAWAIDAPWNDAAMTASPVGWLPTQRTAILAPTYAPGYPILMALVDIGAGPDAMFFVVPVLGAALVWFTYLLGARLGGPVAGAIAAVLLACSPTFVMLQQQVMSDIPVAAFWTLALVVALNGDHPFRAGAATAMAVLIRPNLAPLALVPLVLLTWRRDRPLARLVWFAVPVCVAAALIAALNAKYYGSPLRSGYGPLASLYSRTRVWPNLLQYGRWFAETHTSLVLLGFFAAAVPTADRAERFRVVLVSLVFPLAVLVHYLPYTMFQSFEWWYTRFLLPGYPALLAGLGTLLVGIVRRSRRTRALTIAAAVIVLLVATHGWSFVIGHGLLSHKAGDERFVRTVEYIRRLPPRSIYVSLSHSGTIRFYTGRDIFRFESADPKQLDLAMAHLRQLGYRLYLVGDEFEIEMFHNRFAATQTATTIEPSSRVNLGGVSIYPLNAED